VLIRLTTNRRPGNSVRATAMPVEIPMKRLMNVADPETTRENKVMSNTSRPR
jgi:hypothetical protein